jgi:hypothetical protein
MRNSGTQPRTIRPRPASSGELTPPKRRWRSSRDQGRMMSFADILTKDGDPKNAGNTARMHEGILHECGKTQGSEVVSGEGLGPISDVLSAVSGCGVVAGLAFRGTRRGQTSAGQMFEPGHMHRTVIGERHRRITAASPDGRRCGFMLRGSAGGPVPARHSSGRCTAFACAGMPWI